uniref:Uncharacterized protein n=1 Tax=Fagus sylvatica TaxID=28930 RepID=A0A2N9EI42_FAGSY
MDRSRSNDTEPPSSPLSSTTLRLSSLSSDLVLFGGDLLDALGGSSVKFDLTLQWFAWLGVKFQTFCCSGH